MSEKSPRHVCPIGIDEDFLKPTIEHSIHQESTSAELGSGSTDCCSVDSIHLNFQINDSMSDFWFNFLFFNKSNLAESDNAK